MSAETKIAWTDATFNPWMGCSPASAGCTHCYAEAMAKRCGWAWGLAPRHVTSEAYWRQPRKWNEAARKAGVRRRVFCGSLCDVFEDRTEVVEPRARLRALIAECDWLDFLLLTKRPFNQRLWGADFRDNVWFGTTCEGQEALRLRVPRVFDGRAKVRFLSCEPLLEPLNLSLDVWRAGEGCLGINWVIVGSESGPHARPMEDDWARSIVRQCRENGVACFVKQLSRPGMPRGVSHDPSEWPADLRVRQWPKT